jgi:hypothetical protein
MSGALSVPLIFAAIYFQGAPLKLMFACVAVLALVQGCFVVWRDSMNTALRTIAAQNAEIEKLSHRDYDDSSSDDG